MIMSDPEGPWSTPPPQRPQAPPTRRGRGLIFVVLLVAGAALIVWLSKLFPGQVSGRDWTSPAVNLGFAALVGASLLSTRLKLGQAARYLAIWGVVAGVLGLGYVYRGDAMDAFYRVRSALVPSYATQTGPNTVVLTESRDGGYDVRAEVNGQPVTFMVDTGASDVVLSPADARRLGVDRRALRFDRRYETANGAGFGADWRADSLSIGPIRMTDVPVSVNRTPMSRSLLGMSFLKRLDSFEFKGDQLVLRGQARQ
jgi:aspartyl protease family protein